MDDKLVQSLPPIDKATEKKLLRKCDLHVVPIISMLYVLSFLDRINIGNARIQGLETDLDMSGQDYNIALMVFFIPYILFEVPSNILIRKIRPSTWLSLLMMAWGIFTVSGWLQVIWLIDVFRNHDNLHGDHEGLYRSPHLPNTARVVRGRFHARYFWSQKTILHTMGANSDPGCLYLMSMYYRRYELQKRFTFFFCSAILAGAFSGVCT